MKEIYDTFYESENSLTIGSIVLCPVPNLEEVPRILEVERNSPEEHLATKFKITQINDTHFHSKEKLPIKHLRLGTTEELIISKAKKRFCIVLSINNTNFSDTKIITEIGKKSHLQDNSIIVAPIYSISTLTSNSGFGPIMTTRIQCLMYNQFFFLPKDKQHGVNPLSQDSIIRFDRVFATHNKGRSLYPTNFRLTSDVMAVIQSMIHVKFGLQTENEDLKALKEILLESLPQECKI